jgi:hypothetical protein
MKRGKWAQFNHGKGLPKTMPKRGVCPKCGKRGMGQPKPAVVVAKMLTRMCMYCGHVERTTW